MTSLLSEARTQIDLKLTKIGSHNGHANMQCSVQFDQSELLTLLTYNFVNYKFSKNSESATQQILCSLTRSVKVF